MIELPLDSNPEQLFSITLENELYSIKVTLNSRNGIWYISFAKDGIDIVNGVAIVGGIDILQQYNLPIGNIYMVNLDNPSNDPSKTDLGTVSKLFILSDEEIANG